MVCSYVYTCILECSLHVVKNEFFDSSCKIGSHKKNFKVLGPPLNVIQFLRSLANSCISITNMDGLNMCWKLSARVSPCSL